MKSAIRLDKRGVNGGNCEPKANDMWPVMTLTLLLQLTDEEQLFAQQAQPAVVPQEASVEAPAVVPSETCAQWPKEESVDC